jgi:hypothetical protein
MPTITIAGLSVSLEWDGVPDFSALMPRYAPFLIGEVATLHLHLYLSVQDGYGPLSASVEPAIQLRLVSAPDGYDVTGPGVRGDLDFARGEARVTLDSGAAPARLEYLLRTIYAYLALRECGLLIHSAGLCSDSDAYLFMGQSGSGKSTVTSLSPSALALSDDLVLIKPSHDGWQAYSTPFWNAASLNRPTGSGSGRVVGCYKLIQSRSVRAERLPTAAAVAELIANCPVVNADPTCLPDLLARCRSLAQTIPIYALHFRKDASFWEAIRPVLQPDQPSEGPA